MPIKQNVTYKLTSSLKFCNRLSQLNGLISLAEMLVHQITNHARLSAKQATKLQTITATKSQPIRFWYPSRSNPFTSIYVIQVSLAWRKYRFSHEQQKSNDSITQIVRFVVVRCITLLCFKEYAIN